MFLIGDRVSMRKLPLRKRGRSYATKNGNDYQVPSDADGVI